MTDRRKKQRLDYRVLHNTGDKVYKEEGEVFRSVSSTPTKSSEDDSAETTLDQSQLEDYHDVDELFNNELSDLSEFSEFSFILENVPTTVEIVVSTRIFYGNEMKYNKTKGEIK